MTEVEEYYYVLAKVACKGEKNAIWRVVYGHVNRRRLNGALRFARGLIKKNGLMNVRVVQNVPIDFSMPNVRLANNEQKHILSEELIKALNEPVVEGTEGGIDIDLVTDAFFHFNEAHAMMTEDTFKTAYPEPLRIAFCIVNYPETTITMLRNGSIDVEQFETGFSNAKVITKLSGKGMILEDLSKLFDLTPSYISRSVGKASSSTKSREIRGRLALERGFAFESWVMKRIQGGYSLVECEKGRVIIDADEVVDIQHAEPYKGEPDLVLHMNDASRVVIACRTCTERGSYTINTECDRSDDYNNLSPEISSYFEGIKKDMETNDKMIVLVRNMAFRDFLTGVLIATEVEDDKWQYPVHVPHDFPPSLTFNESRIEKGLLPKLAWVKIQEGVKPKA